MKGQVEDCSLSRRTKEGQSLCVLGVVVSGLGQRKVESKITVCVIEQRKVNRCVLGVVVIGLGQREVMSKIAI